MGRVHVAGSINADVSARVARLPSAGETVAGSDLAVGLGGKGANQAVAAARLDAPVSLLGCVGTDEFGDEVLDRLEREPLSLSHVRQTSAAPTGTALITVDESGENTIVVVPGANEELRDSDVPASAVEPGDVAVSQFEISQPTVRAFFETARSKGATTVLNPAPAATVTASLLPLVDYLVCNETEASFYGDENETPSEERLVDVCEALRAHEEQVVVVTRGDEGVLAVGPTEQVALDSHPVTPVDTTGAGDAFVGAFATAIAEERDLRTALEFANAAGAAATTTDGTARSLPDRAAVRALLGGEWSGE